MTRIELASALLLALAVTGCGDGGSPAPGDAGTTAGSLACVSTGKRVRIQMFGDSTQYGFDGATQAQATTTPASALQAAMDGLFGTGAVTVENRGVFGTTSTMLLLGTDGLNKPWPQSVDADIAVVNHAINDARQALPVDTYERNLRSFVAVPGTTVFLETPNPVRGGADAVDAFAAAMRAVAAEGGQATIDVNAFVHGLDDWAARVPDGTHPDAELYGMIGTQVLAPALAPAVKALRCR